MELFEGKESGKKIKEIIYGKDLFTSVLTLAEISVWCIRNKREPSEFLFTVKNVSTIVLLSEEVSEKAGQILTELRKTSPGIGLIDAIIYTQAMSYGLNVISGDPHFSNLENVEFID